jgi:hypothetical protein
MGLSRLDNFLKNTRGEILYVDPSSLDSTDSVENQGNSLARPFKTIQRALIEAARFSYQVGRDNDRFGKTTILLYPGEHIVDNRPGLIPTGSGNYYLRSGSLTNDLSPFDSNTNFDVLAENNILYKLNSIYGGVIVPRGTSIVGLDLRKTKIRPRYVPNPSNDDIERSAIFRVTGACYFWQFSFFDADPNTICYKDYTTNTFVPNFSHHKLTAFEYADGKNFVNINDEFLNFIPNNKTDLDLYYQKIGDVYGTTSGREIEPETVGIPLDIETKVDEYRIVGSRGAEVGISSIRAGDGSTSTNIITVTLSEELNGLDVDTPIQISGVSVSGYTGQFVISEKISDTEIQYQAPSSPIVALPSSSEIAEATLSIVTDTVTSASPYIFNVSLRSVFGMCGMHADGDKCDGFKSMVVAQFTGIGLQKDNNAFIKYNQTTGAYEDTTTIANLFSNSLSRYKPSYENYHIKASNNSVIQVVSVFAIGYANHFLAESGGDLSITNSNSNFGAKSLISKGFQSVSFAKDDCGYITHIIPPKELDPVTTNIEFNSIDVTKTVGVGTTAHLYLYDEQVEQNLPDSVIDGYRLGAKVDDQLNIDISVGGVTTSYYAKVVMPNTEISYEKSYTVAKKINGVSNEITANIITFISNHNLETGETIRIVSDTGHIPDGLLNNQVYYTITTGLSANQIKIAKTLNDALINQEASIYSNETSIVQVLSRVSDKSPGDIGHPIQWDTYNLQWYINVSETSNTITPLLSTLSSTVTPRSYFVRDPDNRPLSDRIYRLRYVVPKDNPFTARPPIEGYVLQESSDVTGNTVENGKYFSIPSKTLSNSAELRNPRFIANATWDGSSSVTFTTELPHNLKIGSSVEVRNITSTLNTLGSMDVGYNGYYFVTTTPTSKTFTVSQLVDPGTFTNDVSTRDENLPYFAKFEFDGTYTIYRSEEIQRYIKDEQDGIYHIILINASNKPISTPFLNQKYSQPIQNLYPQTNRDNPKSDPDSTICFAKSDPIGEVVVNNPENSLTKETITKLYDDINLGIGITNIVSTPSSGIAHTLFTRVEHGLNRIQKLSIVSPGAGYGSGSGSVIYNATLTGTSSSVTGGSATIVISIDGSGSLTAAKILDGGSGYSVGDQLSVTGTATTTGFTTATLQVTSIYDNIGDTLFITDIGSLYDQYNGLYRITGLSTTSNKLVFVQSADTLSGINTTGIGITVLSNAKGYVLGSTIGISSLSYNNISGIASVTTLTSHGFSKNQKIRIIGANYSGYNTDWLIGRSTSLTSFEINVGVGTTVPNALGTIFALRSGFNSRGGVITPQDENISSRLIETYDNLTTTLAATVSSADITNITISNITVLDLRLGDYLQINDEIVRISESVDGNPVEVFRGALGSKRSTHFVGSVVRRIRPIPVELRRNSIIRASGHTFEYVGFGPGNYSTGLPDRQDRVLGIKETLLSQSNKENGGVVAFTAMDSDGNFFIGNKKLNSITGKEEVFDAPIVTVTGEDITSGGIIGADTQTSSEIIITRSLKVEGGSNNNLITEFNGPVIFNNKITSSSSKGIEVDSLYLQGDSKISRKYTTNKVKPTYEGNAGDVVFNATPDTGGTLGWVYTSDSTWQDFGLISNDTPLSRNLGITTYGGYLGIATNLNLIGVGVSIYGDVDETSGIGTLTFFSSSVEPQFLFVAGISTFQNKIIANNQVFFNAGLIATSGVSTFVSAARFLDGIDVFGGASIDTLTVSGSIITTELNTTTFTNIDSNFAGNISAGTTAASSNTVIKSLSGDNNNAGFEAHGDTQGTGYLFVGSRTSRGGGLSYNGNLSPGFALSEIADSVSFFRRSSSINQVVFSYPYNSNDVTFNGNLFASDITISNITVSNNASITGSISTVSNINSIGISTLPTINNNSITVNTSADLLGPVTQNVVSLGSSTVIDCALGNYFTCTVNGNVTFSFTNVPSSRAFGITLEITHTSGSISWPAEVKFPEDQAPLINSNKTHLFMFVTDNGGTRWRGAALFDYAN